MLPILASAPATRSYPQCRPLSVGLRVLGTLCSACAVVVFPVIFDKLAQAEARPPVVIVRGTCTEREDPGGEGPSAERAARLVSKAFARAGVPFERIGDDEAASGGLLGRRLAVLPYNPRLVPGEREALGEFVRGGGRLIVFYAADRSLWKALGFTGAKVRPRSRGGEFAEMRFAAGLRDEAAGAFGFLPEAIFQDSWNVLEVEPAPGARVLARWHDEEGRPAGTREGLPAVLRGARGVFFTHIMLGAATDAKARMCLALAAGLAGPAVIEPVARAKLARARGVPAWRGLQGLVELARAVGDRRADRERLMSALHEAARAEREAEAALDVAAYTEALRWATVAERKAREAAGLALPARDGEIRAIWVRNPERVVWRDIAPRLAEAGFNVVMPNYVRGLRAAYRSELLETPRQSSLKTCIRECRRAGVEVHVWWTVLFLDDTPRERVGELGREGRLVVRALGDEEGGVVSKATLGWLCPSNEENVELLGKVAREIAKSFRPDGLHLDYVRFPVERSCLCEVCRDSFEARPAQEGGRDEDEWPRAVLPGGRRARDFRRYRRERVSGVVERIAREARRARPGIYVSAAVFPELATCRETLGQDWGDWVARGLVDFILPMDYTDSAEDLTRWVRDQARRLESRVPLVPGIGLAAGRVGIDDPAELLQQIALVRAAGADGYAIFQLDEDFLERHLGIIAAGPGRRGAELRPHGGPALLWQLPRGTDPEAIPAGRTVEVRLHMGLRSSSGLAVRAFRPLPRVALESASGSLIAELGPCPPPGGTARLRVVTPAGPFRITVRGRAKVEGRGTRALVMRSPLYTGITESEREAELARSRPTGPGPRVAVLTGGYGSRGILAALRREGSFAAYPVASLEDLGGGAAVRPDVLVLTQRRDPTELDGAARAAVRLYVEAGGGLLLTHDAVGYRFHPVLFEEIAAGVGRSKSSVVTPVAETRLARMIGPAAVEHAHFDHILLRLNDKLNDRAGSKAEVVARDGPHAVVAWGRVGEGRVAACGVAIGIDADEREHAPAGREAELLLALARYLAAPLDEFGTPP